MMKKINDFLAGWLMTVVGGVFLLLSFILPRAGMAWGERFAWVCVVICGIPLAYLAIWQVIHNKGISKISSALLVTIAMVVFPGAGLLYRDSLLNCFKDSERLWKQTGPFYCMRYTAPNYISTLGGVHTGRDSEVLDAKDQAIPGLYAVGMLGTELWPGYYTCGMPGGANAFNVDSGRRAFRHAAAWCI